MVSTLPQRWAKPYINSLNHLGPVLPQQNRHRHPSTSGRWWNAAAHSPLRIRATVGDIPMGGTMRIMGEGQAMRLGMSMTWGITYMEVLLERMSDERGRRVDFRLFIPVFLSFSLLVPLVPFPLWLSSTANERTKAPNRTTRDMSQPAPSSPLASFIWVIRRIWHCSPKTLWFR